MDRPIINASCKDLPDPHSLGSSWGMQINGGSLNQVQKEKLFARLLACLLAPPHTHFQSEMQMRFSIVCQSWVAHTSGHKHTDVGAASAIKTHLIPPPSIEPSQAPPLSSSQAVPKQHISCRPICTALHPRLGLATVP